MSGYWEGNPRLTPGVHPYADGAGTRLEDAKRAGTLGKLGRAKTPKEPRHYIVTCGGCAYEEQVEGAQRFAAVDHFRDLGWRARSVPGVHQRRWFCPGCQRDRDWSMMFAFASPVLDHLGEKELKSRVLGPWAAGNPTFLRTETEQITRKGTSMIEIKVHNRIFALLLARQQTKEEVADSLCVNAQTLGYIYRQDFTPDLELAHKISDYFGLPLDHVFWRYPPRIFPDAKSPLATIPVESAALGELQLCLWDCRNWLDKVQDSLGPFDALSLVETIGRMDQYLTDSVEDAHHQRPLSPGYFDGVGLFDARMRLQSKVADEIATLAGTSGEQLLHKGLNRSVELCHQAGLMNNENAEELVLVADHGGQQ